MYNDEGGNTLQSQFVINNSNEFDQLLTKYTLKHLKPFQHCNITFKLLDLMRDIDDKDSVTVCKCHVLKFHRICSYILCAGSQHI